MTRLTWDQVGERVFETGVDRGVLFTRNNEGAYDSAHSWNGLTTVTESPSGAESNKQYADNIVYVNLLSAEEFAATLEAFTYPEAFARCDGTALVNGVAIGQQGRESFGLTYRTRVGNDLSGADYGYKLHLIYGAQAAPSEKAYSTINDSPEAMALSWEMSTTPVEVPGTDPVTGQPYKPTALLTIDSTKVPADKLDALEDLLYGTDGQNPRLPLPEEVLAIFAGGAVTTVEPVAPTFNATTDVITIPVVAGVQYFINDEVVAAGPTAPITEYTLVEARPTPGNDFPDNVDADWGFDPTP